MIWIICRTCPPSTLRKSSLPGRQLLLVLRLYGQSNGLVVCSHFLSLPAHVRYAMLGTRRARRNQAYLSEHPTPNLQLPAQPSGCIHTICIFKLRRAGAEQKKKNTTNFWNSCRCTRNSKTLKQTPKLRITTAETQPGKLNRESDDHGSMMLFVK